MDLEFPHLTTFHWSQCSNIEASWLNILTKWLGTTRSYCWQVRNAQISNREARPNRKRWGQ